MKFSFNDWPTNTSVDGNRSMASNGLKKFLEIKRLG
jgi:hypothetical protein